MSTRRLRLDRYVKGLRTELSRARHEADQDDLAYDVDTATIELDVAYTIERSGVTEIWVLARPHEDAADDEESADRDRQRLTLRLSSRPSAAPTDEPSTTAPAKLPRPTRGDGE
jgi:hypothetical protein